MDSRKIPCCIQGYCFWLRTLFCCKLLEFGRTLLSCPHIHPPWLRGEMLASTGFGQAQHPISRIWDHIVLQCFSCTTGGLLAVLLLIIHLFVFPWDPHASQCFSPSPDFLCLLEIREGDARARSLSLEVVECFRENSFFHRETAHCIDVNRALAEFELLWFPCLYVCQNLFKKRKILVTLSGTAVRLFLPLCCAFCLPITSTCCLWFSVLSKLFEKLWF